MILIVNLFIDIKNDYDMWKYDKNKKKSILF